MSKSEQQPLFDYSFKGPDWRKDDYVARYSEYVMRCIEIGKQVLGPYEAWAQKQKGEQHE